MLRSFLLCGLNEDEKYRYQSCEQMLEGLSQLEKGIRFSRESLYELLSLSYQMFIPAGDVDPETFHLPGMASGRRRKDEAGDQGRESEKGTDLFEQTVRKLWEDTRRDEIDWERIWYLYQGLEKFWKFLSHDGQAIAPEIVRMLLDTGIAVSTHRGMSLYALNLAEKMGDLPGEEMILPYLARQLRIAELYRDLLDFHSSERITKKVISSYDRIQKSFRASARTFGLDELSASRMKGLGRALSALGRDHAYLRDLPEEEILALFELALSEFQGDPGNQEITWSHLLHFAVDIGDESLFRKYAAHYISSYTDGSSYQELLTRLYVEDPEERLDTYRLWIYLKGLSRFYQGEVTETVLQRILKFPEDRRLTEGGDFTCMLIFRSAAEILSSMPEGRENSKAAFFLEKALSALRSARIRTDQPLDIMMCISYRILWELYRMKGEKEKNQDLRKQMLNHARRGGWIFGI